MTNTKTDLTPSEELLYCAKERGSSRLSGTLTLRELFQELNSLLPVDTLYVQITLSDGSIALREVGSIQVDFFPLDTSPFIQGRTDLGIAGQETDIASAPLVVPALPIPKAPQTPKVKPSTKTPKLPSRGKKSPLKADSNGITKGDIPLQLGSLSVNSVLPCPPGKEQEYSRFGQSSH